MRVYVSHALSSMGSDAPSFVLLFIAPFALSFISFCLISVLSYLWKQQHPMTTKKIPTVQKAIIMIQPQMLPSFPTKNILARKRLKKPFPDTVFRKRKCLMTKLKSQKERTRRVPNNLR